MRFKSFDGMAIPNILYKPHQATADGQGARPRLGARRPRRPDAQGLQRPHPVPGQPRLRGARHQQPRQLGLRPDLLHRRRPEARQGAALGLRRGQEVPGRRCPTWTRTASASSAAATAATWCSPPSPSSPRCSRSGVDIFGVSNWLRTLESIPSWWEAQRVALYKEIGDPVTQKEMLREISPVFHADKIRRPLIVLQGANDPRVIKPESDDIVAAVKKNGVPVEYVVFPDEGHGFTKRPNQIKGYGAIREFLDRYLKGPRRPRPGGLVRVLAAIAGRGRCRDAARRRPTGEALATLRRWRPGAGEGPARRGHASTRARHGQTALYFAADKGRLEVVRLLVERGANVNVRDAFFGCRPSGSRCGNGHLRSGPLPPGPRRHRAPTRPSDGGGRAVTSTLARAALEHGAWSPSSCWRLARRPRPRRRRARRGAAEVRGRCLKACYGARPKRERLHSGRRTTVRPTPAVTAGRSGARRRVEVRGDGLVLFAAGPARARAARRGRGPVRERRPATWRSDFGGRAGLVEGLRVNRAGDVSHLERRSRPIPRRCGRPAPAARPPWPWRARAARPWPQFRGERASRKRRRTGRAPRVERQGRPQRALQDGPARASSLSSPIVWGDRIFVTTAVSSQGRHHVPDRASTATARRSTTPPSTRSASTPSTKDGPRSLWEREVFRGLADRYAATSSRAWPTPPPSPTASRVVVLFGIVGVLAAYDFEGQALWRRGGVRKCAVKISGGERHDRLAITHEG